MVKLYHIILVKSEMSFVGQRVKDLQRKMNKVLIKVIYIDTNYFLAQKSFDGMPNTSPWTNFIFGPKPTKSDFDIIWT